MNQIYAIDSTRISHRDDLEDLVQKGADLEKVVLSRAVNTKPDGRRPSQARSNPHAC